LALLAGLSQRVSAQGLPGSDVGTAPASGGAGGELEELYDKDDQAPPVKSKAPAINSSKAAGEAAKVPEAQNLSDLAKLAPFSDVAVIQRRFLPKTNRFEASLTAFTSLNNPFYSSYGGSLSLAYYLREQWAIEAIGNFSTTAASTVTNNLASNRLITTNNLVTSNAFYGGALKWNPIYGKMTWLNDSIVPFDLNFSVGGGVTRTTDGQSPGTLHMGSSQVFAITKAMALRWDFTWNFYQANGTNTAGQSVKVNQNDVYLGIGMSFYFPEASYR
jgi:outer membrane beta-barrel protein